MLRLLCAQVLYFKCRCAASVLIIEDFHTIGQNKRLSLACARCQIGFRRLFRHKLSPGFTHILTLSLIYCAIALLISTVLSKLINVTM